MKKLFQDDVSIVLAGEAGQGIQSIEAVLTSLIKIGGYHVFATKEYMSRVRGGVNSIEIRVSDKRVSGFVERIDILIPFNQDAVSHLSQRITNETVIIGEKEKIKAMGMIDVPFSSIATDVGGLIYSNTVATGFIAGLLHIDTKISEKFMSDFFKSKGEDIVQKNITAIKKGFELSSIYLAEIQIDLKKDFSVASEMIFSGSEAVALGAAAGGCNYVCAYPMSPSTGVLEKMADYSRTMDIVVEQVEDEIGVVNMALGSWYAGARALVTTSGGGFALMTEGVSLAGMTELPLVIHLAQRPGPATGLPTRTMQGDFNLVLYAGHGEFPRIILAPGTLEQGFFLTAKAMNLADEFQSPVFVLTDQYFVDSYYNTPMFDVTKIISAYHIIETEKDYKRYRLTENGLSPRGIPGFGDGIVCVDSDEHDEGGYITEDLSLRIKMNDKRMKKASLINDSAIPPDLYGPGNYEDLIVCWGSTLSMVLEASQGLEKTAVLHFSWLYPLPKEAEGLLKKAKRTILVENNEIGQFGRLLEHETGVQFQKKLLKYNGLPFSAEEIKKIVRF